MNLLHFGRFFTSYLGGLERHVVLLTEYLAREIHVDNLVSGEGLRSDSLTHEGVRIYRVPTLFKLARTAISPTMPFKMFGLLRKHKYEIVHLHFPDPLSCVCALLLPRRVRIVITWHSDIIKQKRLLKLYQPLVNRLLKRTDAVIAATPRHFESSEQLHALPENRRHVIPFGIKTKNFEATEANRAAARNIKANHPDKGIVFAMGRHVYYKGFEFLIRAMEHLENSALYLGGDGPLREELEELVKEKGLGEKVIFTGKISDEDVTAYYYACDVFCMPSIEPSEAFGLVQLEAMACRRPVVCCELNNGVTFVNQHGKSGLVAPPRDPEALAKALDTLLQDPDLRKKMGEYGYQRMRETFSAEQMAQSTLALYRELPGKN